MAEPQLKKLTLKEVARRFEQGDDGALEDYRVHNLHEATVQSSEALQETLRSMPVARNVIQDMLKVTKAVRFSLRCRRKALPRWLNMLVAAQDLSGRVAGRNSDDAAQINAGLMHLLEHLQSYEVSTVQAAKELANTSALGNSSNSKPDSIPALLMPAQIQEETDQIAELKQRCSILDRQCTELQLERDAQTAQITERDGIISTLRQQLEACSSSNHNQPQKEARASPDRGALSEDIHIPDHDGIQSEGAAGEACSGREPAGGLNLPPPDRQQGDQATSSASDELSIGGRLEVGGTLHVGASGSGGAPLTDFTQLQWLRARRGDPSRHHVISGAIRQQYSPEPADIDCVLHCRVCQDDVVKTISCSQPITASPELEADTERLVAAAAAGEAASFVVVPVQHNGAVQRRRSVAMLSVATSGVTLQSGDTGGESAVAPFHVDMQVCGARGGGDGAAQGLFLAMSSQHVFMLALETPAKRNMCILFLRKMASLQGLHLEGPIEP